MTFAPARRWLMREPAPPTFLATLPTYGPLLATLLYQRGLRDPEAVDTFLRDDYPTGLHDPLAMHGMDAAARRIAQAIERGEQMAVYGDFDTDGVTAVALLMRAIPALGGRLRPYIPHRQREGYGLNMEAVEQLHADGVALLITVDCGVSNVAEVAHAQALGLDVIVTDHHSPPAVLPPALALVNPKQPGCPYPFKDLVGVGIAFKLVQALWKLGLRGELTGRDLLDVVALGTVTDMGPLLGENRVLVRAGLQALNATTRPGLRALVEAAGLSLGSVDASAIGYMLGPRLNAAGRLDDAILAYQLLLAPNDAAARTLAGELNEANRRRQELTRQVQEQAQAQATATDRRHKRLVFLHNAAFPAGVVGLVAGRLSDEWGRPVLIMETGSETSRGSARSVPGFSVVAALAQCADLLVRYGGHDAAAGFTVNNHDLPALEQRLLDIAAAQISDDMLSPTLTVDAELPLGRVSWELLHQLECLEPCGQANPRPTLLSRRVRVTGAWGKGADGRTLKLRLVDERNQPFDAVGFRMGHLAEALQGRPLVDAVYRIEANEWNGDRRLQLRLLDLRPAE